KCVSLSSSVRSAAKKEVVNKRNETLQKPKLVLYYIHIMGGGDKNDQNPSYHRSDRHQQKVFYKTIFRHLVDMAVFNACILFKKESGGKDTHWDFRMSLGRSSRPKTFNLRLEKRREGAQTTLRHDSLDATST
ncbi:hypothetical protein HPB47_017777, partial [Ixodes persulcatus]